jgi:hypothetical protein
VSSIAIRRQPEKDAVVITRVLADERDIFHELIRLLGFSQRLHERLSEANPSGGPGPLQE